LLALATGAFPNVMGNDAVTNFGTAMDTLQFNATLSRKALPTFVSLSNNRYLIRRLAV
jgi:hypothetical protein